MVTGFVGPDSPTHYVEIGDTGPGMTPAFIETELFQPFATTKEKGIGLGMYEAQYLLQRLGGTIDVQSRVGEGTSIRIEFGQSHENSTAG